MSTVQQEINGHDKKKDNMSYSGGGGSDHRNTLTLESDSDGGISE